MFSDKISTRKIDHSDPVWLMTATQSFAKELCATALALAFEVHRTQVGEKLAYDNLEVRTSNENK